MSKITQINVACQCGFLLFKYEKHGRGRLIKCFLENILLDHAGVKQLSSGSHPVCPSCKKNLGEIRLVNGRAALKLNQGTVKKITT